MNDWHETINAWQRLKLSIALYILSTIMVKLPAYTVALKDITQIFDDLMAFKEKNYPVKK